MKSEKSKPFHEDNNPCDVERNLQSVIVDCSGRSLESVKRSWFPEDTTEIMLQNNKLKVVSNNMTNNLYKLEILSLQDNRLSDIQSGAFKGLHELRYLNLENNQMNLFNLPVDIFWDLSNLTELRLLQPYDDSVWKVQERYNVSNDWSFPEHMFGRLVNLNILTVTVFNEVLFFNSEFTNLKSLSDLKITGSISFIAQDSFQNVRFVETLYLDDLQSIRDIDHRALEPFLRLKNLRYNRVQINFLKALNALGPLVKTNMTKITFYGVHVGSSNYGSIAHGDGILNSTNTQFLTQICLEELNLQANYIFLINSGALKSPTFDRCLKRLYIDENKIKGSTLALLQTLKLKNLQSLFISGGDCVNAMSGLLPFSLSKDTVVGRNLLHKSSGTSATDGKQWQDRRSIPSDQYDFFHLIDPTYYNLSSFIFYMSPSIEYLEVSSVLGHVDLDTSIHFSGAQNVRSLYLRNNNIRNVQTSFTGFTRLNILDLSFNDFSVFPASFFNSFPTVRDLSLKNCKLSGSFMSENSFELFQNLTNLYQLDLSSNSLDILSPNSFTTNPSLVSLNLSDNRFKNIPFQLDRTPNLKELDLQLNALTTISDTDRAKMDRNQERLGDFDLYLSGNILSCACDNLPFLRWLQLTKVQFDNYKNFTCIDDKGILRYTLNYELEGFWRECSGEIWLNFSIVLLFITFTGFLLVFIWTNNKNFIKARLMQIFTDFKLNKISDYRYGVYIDYAESDYRFPCFELRQYIENELHLSTFLRHRDMLPSATYAQGVMDAIHSSWRVVLVISGDFLEQNDWLMFSIRSSVYSVSPTNPSRIVVLVEENLVSKLPTELLSSVGEDGIVVVTQWAMTYELKQTLRTRLCCYNGGVEACLPSLQSAGHLWTSEKLDQKMSGELPKQLRQLVAKTLGTRFREVTEIVEVPTPELGAKGVLVKNKYVGINASDINCASGRYDPNGKPPIALGFEGLGEVVAVGPEATTKIGQTVIYTKFGSFCDYIVIEEAKVIPVPSSDPAFLTLLVSGLTASVSLDKEADLKPGKTVLVTAAAGGTGQFAVQLAKLAGCHVIGTCSSEDKVQFLKGIGCDRAINYSTDSLQEVLSKEYPKGVDVVYETIGNEVLDAALKNLAVFGRLIVIGSISNYDTGSAGDIQSKSQINIPMTGVRLEPFKSHGTAIMLYYIRPSQSFYLCVRVIPELMEAREWGESPNAMCGGFVGGVGASWIGKVRGSCIFYVSNETGKCLLRLVWFSDLPFKDVTIDWSVEKVLSQDMLNAVMC
ncbi:hypothetical protein Btru_025346, partial [Bulinus truncatus]